MRSLPLALLMVATASAAVAQDNVVATFSGTGPMVTDSFAVEDGWDLRWEAEGRRFQVTVLGTQTDIPSVAVDQIEPGAGTRNFARGGDFRLEIRANGPWVVEVVQ